MSYSYDKLHLDMIDASHGENVDVLVHLNGRRYLVRGVEPEQGTGEETPSLVLKLVDITKETSPPDWPNHEIGDHMRRRHGFESVWAGTLLNDRRERLAQHDLDHHGGPCWAGSEPMGHIHPNPADPSVIKEV